MCRASSSTPAPRSRARTAARRRCAARRRVPPLGGKPAAARRRPRDDRGLRVQRLGRAVAVPPACSGCMPATRVTVESPPVAALELGRPVRQRRAGAAGHGARDRLPDEGAGASEAGAAPVPADRRARRLEQAEVERHIADLVRLVLLTGPGRAAAPAGLRRRPRRGGAVRAARRRRSRASSRCAPAARSSGALGDRIEVLELTVEHAPASRRCSPRSPIGCAAPRRRSAPGGGACRADAELLEPTCPPSARPEKLFDPATTVHGLRAAQTAASGGAASLDVWLYQDPPAALADPVAVDPRARARRHARRDHGRRDRGRPRLRTSC